MPRSISGLVCVALSCLAFGGCVAPATMETTGEGAATRGAEAGEERTASTETPRAESNERSSADTRSDTPTDQAKLVADLNDASRELATLRAAYARLRAERGGSSSAPRAAEAAKADAADDKLSVTLKSYGALKQELAGIIAEMERARADSAAATAKLKDVSSRTEDSRATIAKLESELRAERKARDQAEQALAKMQDQMRTVARALSNAGLSVDKLGGGRESGSR